MNWHETIIDIQNNPEFNALVRQTYITSDLEWNVRAFEESEEFLATLEFIQQYTNSKGKLLDIGAGNGISSIAFSKLGYQVTALEPDPSDLVGAEAIRRLGKNHSLENLSVIEGYAEDIIEGKAEYFDLIYARQSLHHAADLKKYVENAFYMLKPGGLFLTIRDHVVNDRVDLESFLNHHPLHKFYGGENAFTEGQYLEAFTDAGFRILKIYKHYDSVINYAPLTKLEVDTIPSELQKKLSRYIGKLAFKRPVLKFVRFVYDLLGRKLYDEQIIPGRLRSFILTKPEA
ncbi:class I SAM-dependent methyltransferase [Salibacteraceae bacterium]|nr:class I SAM-dependent methyltransferase [Salibacteraceae bacterium]